MDRPIVFGLRIIIRKYSTTGSLLGRAKFGAVSTTVVRRGAKIIVRKEERTVSRRTVYNNNSIILTRYLNFICFSLY
jgi:hypothetical protein